MARNDAYSRAKEKIEAARRAGCQYFVDYKWMEHGVFHLRKEL